MLSTLDVAQLDRDYLGDVVSRVLITAPQVSLLERFHDLASDLPLGLIDPSSGRPVLSALPSWVDVILIRVRRRRPDRSRWSGAEPARLWSSD